VPLSAPQSYRFAFGQKICHDIFFGSKANYFGPDFPGEGKNWVRTVPSKGYFVALRLYGPMKAFFDHSWKPGDIEKIK
jgi:hypothetical protein